MHRYKSILFFLLLLPFSSCDFGNTNVDPTRPIDAELKELLPSAMAQTARNLNSIGARVSGTVVQHFKGIDAQPEAYNQYLIDERTLDEFWRTGLYRGAMKDCALIVEKSVAENRPHYQGIANILMAINLGIATSFWGDVPYSSAFKGLGDLYPSYDTQEDIYIAIQDLLQVAIENLQQDASENAPQIDDLIFQGKSQLWILTAQALKARYLLHTIHQTSTPQDIINVLKNDPFQSGSLGNAIIHSLDQQANFPFGGSINEANPLPLFGFERPDQILMSDYLLQVLQSTADPRLASLAVLENEKAIIYRKDYDQLYWGQFDAPVPLISLTEVKFIEAEAYLRLGQIAEAQSSFIAAVKANCEQLQIPANEYEPFINDHIHFENSINFEQQIELLIQQKHLALFGQNAIEAWTDFRRTGFPNITPPSNANASLNPSLVIPKRFLYPISERTANETNWSAAIQRQGGHLMDIGLWAFE